jgi:hypothetical protein
MSQQTEVDLSKVPEEITKLAADLANAVIADLGLKELSPIASTYNTIFFAVLSIYDRDVLGVYCENSRQGAKVLLSAVGELMVGGRIEHDWVHTDSQGNVIHRVKKG